MSTPASATVTAQNTFKASDVTSIVLPAASAQDSPTIYILDGIMRVEHRRSVNAAEHPVQNSAPITDHLCVQPFELVLDFAVSDSMIPIQPNQWAGNYSQSVNAWLTLLGLQGAALLTVNTRLNQYENMAIRDYSTHDDYKTFNSLRATLTLRQIITASILTDSGVSSGNSDRPLQTEQVPTQTRQPLIPDVQIVSFVAHN